MQCKKFPWDEWKNNICDEKTTFCTIRNLFRIAMFSQLLIWFFGIINVYHVYQLRY